MCINTTTLQCSSLVSYKFYCLTHRFKELYNECPNIIKQHPHLRQRQLSHSKPRGLQSPQMMVTSIHAEDMRNRRSTSRTADSYCKAAEEAARACYLLRDNLYKRSFETLHRAWYFWDFSVCDVDPFVAAAVDIIAENPDDHTALSIALFSTSLSNLESLQMARRCVELDPS